jgi:hypothetical protein
MLHVRVVKIKAGSQSVQVIRYENGRRVIVKHIGTCRTDEEIIALTEIARSYIEDPSQQPSLFANAKLPDAVVMLSQCK